jgi:hypothetical protein
VAMAQVDDRVSRLEGISEQVNERLGSLDMGLREGMREIRDELRTMHARVDGLNTRLDAKASTGLVLGLGVWLSLSMTLLTVLTRR